MLRHVRPNFFDTNFNPRLSRPQEIYSIYWVSNTIPGGKPGFQPKNQSKTYSLMSKQRQYQNEGDYFLYLRLLVRITLFACYGNRAYLQHSV